MKAEQQKHHKVPRQKTEDEIKTIKNAQNVKNENVADSV
jgi:hypothetical protein